MLLTLPDILNATEVAEARAALATAPWADDRPGAGRQPVQVKNNEQLPLDCTVSRQLGAQVLAALQQHPLVLSAALPRRIFPPRFNRYRGTTNHYGNHVDGAVRLLPGSGQPLRTDLSCTLFLSDPASYDGGELVMQEPGGEQRIKLPAGHLVLYPGTTVHQVTPVTRGERLACFFWIESLVRGSDQRRLLYEMDMALMALRQRDGESPEAVALTGCYHNLLRLWAET